MEHMVEDEFVFITVVCSRAGIRGDAREDVIPEDANFSRDTSPVAASSSQPRETMAASPSQSRGNVVGSPSQPRGNMVASPSQPRENMVVSRSQPRENMVASPSLPRENMVASPSSSDDSGSEFPEEGATHSRMVESLLATAVAAAFILAALMVLFDVRSENAMPPPIITSKAPALPAAPTLGFSDEDDCSSSVEVPMTPIKAKSLLKRALVLGGAGALAAGALGAGALAWSHRPEDGPPDTPSEPLEDHLLPSEPPEDPPSNMPLPPAPEPPAPEPSTPKPPAPEPSTPKPPTPEPPTPKPSTPETPTPTPWLKSIPGYDSALLDQLSMTDRCRKNFKWLIVDSNTWRCAGGSHWTTTARLEHAYERKQKLRKLVSTHYDEINQHDSVKIFLTQNGIPVPSERDVDLSTEFLVARLAEDYYQAAKDEEKPPTLEDVLNGKGLSLTSRKAVEERVYEQIVQLALKAIGESDLDTFWKQNEAIIFKLHTDLRIKGQWDARPWRWHWRVKEPQSWEASFSFWARVGGSNGVATESELAQLRLWSLSEPIPEAQSEQCQLLAVLEALDSYENASSTIEDKMKRVETALASNANGSFLRKSSRRHSLLRLQTAKGTTAPSDDVVLPLKHGKFLSSSNRMNEDISLTGNTVAQGDDGVFDEATGILLPEEFEEFAGGEDLDGESGDRGLCEGNGKSCAFFGSLFCIVVCFVLALCGAMAMVDVGSSKPTEEYAY